MTFKTINIPRLKSRLVSAFVASALITISFTAQAYTVYTNRTDWENAVTGSITTDTFSNDITRAPQITLDSGIISKYIGPSGRIVSNEVAGNNINIGRYSGWVNPQATFIPKKSIGWTFPSTVTAFGGDIQNVLNTSGSLRITGDFDGNGDATINVNTGFIGIVGNKPFSAILWDGDAGGTNFKVDNFSLAVVPLPTLSLKAGFNLLTYPVEPVGGFSCQAFKTQLGAGMLGRLDSASQVFQSCGTSQFPIQAGEGYVIEMPEDRILEVSGEPSCPTIDLAAGLNLVGIPTPAAGFSCYALLQTLGGPTIVTVVQRYAVDSGAYESCGYAEGDVVPRGVDFPIRAEEAYLISLQSPWPEFWVCRARA